MTYNNNDGPVYSMLSGKGCCVYCENVTLLRTPVGGDSGYTTSNPNFVCPNGFTLNQFSFNDPSSPDSEGGFFCVSQTYIPIGCDVPVNQHYGDTNDTECNYLRQKDGGPCP